MLKQLRNKKTAKKIWIILAIIVVPAFIFWGFGSATRSQKEASFAGRIFNKNISFREYKESWDAVRLSAIMRFGENFSQIQKYLNLDAQAWERLILLYEAKKRKIRASDNEVIEFIRSEPFFQYKGRFDQRIYTQMLQYLRVQPRLFEEQTRQNIMLSKLYEQVTANIRLNEPEIKDEYVKYNEEISLYYIAGLPADFAKDTSATEEEIRDFFAKNSLDFKQPLSFNLEYAAFDSEDKAKEAYPRLNKKRDFAAAAKEAGWEAKSSGFFSLNDPIPGIGWSPEILALVMKLKPGQTAGPVQADKNYFILRLKEKKDSSIPEFELIKDKVREALIKEKSLKIAKEKTEEALKYLQGTSADFDRAAKACGLKSASTGLFKYGSYIEGIGASDSFWNTAKGLKEDAYSGLISIPSGFYIIKLKSRQPVDEKKFEGEKTEFSEKLLLQKKQESFSNFLEELKRKAG